MASDPRNQVSGPFLYTIDGRAGRDVITGSAVDAQVFGGAGADELVLSAFVSADVAPQLWLDGGAGADHLETWAFARSPGELVEGIPTAVTLSGVAVSEGGAGNDTILIYGALAAMGGYGGVGDDVISLWSQGSGTIWAEGGDGADRIVVESLPVVFQPKGASVPSYLTSDIYVDGGAGDDEITLAGAGYVAQVNAGAGNDVVRLGDGHEGASDHPEASASVTLTLGDGSDLITGWGEADVAALPQIRVTDFDVTPGADHVDVTELLTGLEAQGLWDGVANPFGTGLLSLAQNGADTDLVLEAAGSHVLVTFEGLAPGDFAQDHFVPPLAPDGTAPQSMDHTGTSGDEVFHGSAVADRLDGGAGNDWIEGGAGDDVLLGGAGDDRIYAGQGADQVAGGTGDDRIWVSQADGLNAQVDAGDGDDEVTGALAQSGLSADLGAGADRLDLDSSGDSDIQVIGATGADVLSLSHDGFTALSDPEAPGTFEVAGQIALEGGAGADEITVQAFGFVAIEIDGGDDDDLIEVEATGDGAAAYPLTQGQVASSALIVSAGAGDDTVVLEARDVADVQVDLGSGRDLLRITGDGASGARITTGEGADIITPEPLIYTGASGSGARVLDFTPGAGGDQLDLGPILDELRATGQLGLNANPFANPFAGPAPLIRLVQNGADAELQVFDSQSFFTVLTLEGVSVGAFTAANIVQDLPLDGTLPTAVLSGSAAGDVMVARPTIDTTLTGQGGDDRLSGGLGDDHLLGGAGDDVLMDGHGGNILDGGAGDDLIHVSGGTAWVLGGTGEDRIDAGPADDTLSEVTIFGDEGADHITVREAAFSYVYGGDEADVIAVSVSQGAEVVVAEGGAGDDTLRVSANGEAGQSGEMEVLGGAGRDRIDAQVAVAQAHIDGGAGDDNIFVEGVAGAAITLSLGAGQDLMTLGAGEASVVVTDFAVGPAGDVLDLDAVLVAARDAGLWDGAQDPYDSGLMDWVQSGADAQLWIDEGAGARLLVTLQGVDIAELSADNFSPAFDLGAVAEGRQIGTPGADSLTGGAGSDWLLGGLGDDLLAGGEGADRISGSFGDDALTGGGGDDWLTDGSGVNSFDGGAGADVLIGSGHSFDGGAGNDRIEAVLWQDGPSLVEGGDGDDVIAFSKAAAGPYRPAEVSTVDGVGPYEAVTDVTVSLGGYTDGGADQGIVIFGGAGADAISGHVLGHAEVDAGAGDDRVDLVFAYADATRVTLGEGADVFSFQGISADLRVSDFSVVEDRLSLGEFAEQMVFYGHFDAEEDPFQSGQLHVVQDGADAVLMLEGFGASGPISLLRLDNTEAEHMTRANVDMGRLTAGARPTGEVVVGGAPEQGQVLTADASSLEDADGMGAVTIQWLRDGIEIEGAQGDSFALTQADVGAAITAQARFVDQAGLAEVVNSATTAPVENVNDAPTGEVSITGRAAVGEVLGVEASGLDDADGLGSFTYQWQRGGVDISGADGETYTLSEADLGAEISVVLSYVDGYGQEEQVASHPSAAILPANHPATGFVILDGLPRQGERLTASYEVADDDGLGVVQLLWLRDGVQIVGATGDSYTLGQADVGAEIMAEVRFTDLLGGEEVLASAPTDPVENVNDAPTGGVSLLGVAREDERLGVDLSALADVDGLGAFSYQWMRDGEAVAGATSDSYHLTQTDVAAELQVVVSYEDGFGAAERVLSAVSAPVENVNDAPQGAVGLLGTPADGEVLRADLSGVSDEDGLGVFSYQWHVAGVEIEGATGEALTLIPPYIGASATLVVTYTDGSGTVETLVAESATITRPPMSGSDAGDKMRGSAEADVLAGEAGNDRLLGRDGDDQLDGGAGKDRLKGGAGDDSLSGGAGKDVLAGGRGADDLDGGEGRDRLVGGAGDDVQTGGEGADLFVFSKGTGSDVITDFDVTQDRISLKSVAAIRNWRDLKENHLSDDGFDTVIDDGAGHRITLEGVLVADLSKDDFVF